MAQDRITYNICPISGCHENCILKVHSREDKIYKVEMPDLPEAPEWRAICSRGLASLRLLYSPERIKYPLKRVGARGEGKWKRISWDEALDEIAGKLLEIKEKYGANSVMIRPSGSSTVGLVSTAIGSRFANLWGSCGFEGKGWSSDGGGRAASLLVFGDSGQGHTSEDCLNSRMVILWGPNACETRMRMIKSYLDARDRGAKLVMISPMYHATAAKCDLWIPVRLGTDTALAMSMINVIIDKKLYDEDFIRNHSVGPFLVNPKNGHFLREKDLQSGGDPKKYVILDASSGKAVADDKEGAVAFILGRHKVGGLECPTAFQLLVERAAEYRPDIASTIIGTPAETIEKLAVEYAASRPASIQLSDGMTYTKYGDIGVRAVLILATITGNMGIKGGGASTGGGGVEPIFNMRKAAWAPGFPGASIIPGSKNVMRGWNLIMKGKTQPIKAAFLFYHNPLQAYGNATTYIEAFKKMELVVVSDVQMSWTAQYADYVLPDAMCYEREDVWRSGPYIVYMQKAVEPPIETRSCFEIWKGLAERVGFRQHFSFTIQEFIEVLLDSESPLVRGLDIEKLKKEGLFHIRMPYPPPIAFPDKKFPTPSGRAEFYVEELSSFGDALPVHREPLESPLTSPLASKYPLSLFTRKRRQHMGSTCAHIDWLLELEREPYLEINPVDASKREVRPGDRVRVFNDRGEVEVKAKLIESTPPGSVNIYHGWWPDQFYKGHYNLLLRGIDDVEQINPSLETPRIIPDLRASAHLIYNDCLVEVEKVK